MKSVSDKLKNTLEDIYCHYNRRQFVHPDPLEFLYEYSDPADRELVALLAASLAYGRVAQILRNVRRLLDLMGPHPRQFLEKVRPCDLHDMFAPFKHRWTTGREVACLLIGMARTIKRHGLLRNAFLAGLQPGDETTQPALARFVETLLSASDLPRSSLLPVIGAGGACKRMHLFLRWMVRRDEVDPGDWSELQRARLIVPLDTHMHRLGLGLGFTTRRQADLRTALDITQAFRTICPEDPVRYDFALTRFGIRAELDEQALLTDCMALLPRPPKRRRPSSTAL